MKFIFPQNYNFKNKIFGVIDYTTAFVNILWISVIFLIANFIFNSLSSKIFTVIVLCLPLFLFSFAGFHGENILYVFSYFLHFMFKQKLYFYGKSHSK